MKTGILYISLIIVLALTSCHDFLTKYPKDTVYPSCTDDFHELLIGDGYLSGPTRWDIGKWLNLMDDDVEYTRTVTAVSTSTQLYLKFYNWEANPDAEPTWSNLYKHILCLNTILSEIDDFKDEKGDGYRRIKGESHFLRAGYYFFLTNIYAKPYSKATANRELGIPLKLTAKLEDRNFTRNTLQECYDQMISDLQNATVCLKGIDQPTTFRASAEAAHLLLSRLYLYMGEWDKCVEHCDSVMKKTKYHLLDYNTVTAGKTLSATSPETIFTNGGNSYGGSNELYMYMYRSFFRVRDEFLKLYAQGDLRNKLFFKSGNFGGARYNYPNKQASSAGGEYSDTFGLRLSEAYLNKAEALAILGKEAEAIELLKALRAKRFADKNGGEITQSGEDLVNFIRTERRLEFTFEGHRWFDLRRYAVSPKYPSETSIRHPYYEDGSAVTLSDMVLGKYSEEPSGWTLLIPEDEITENQGALLQNEGRKDRQPESKE